MIVGLAALFTILFLGGAQEYLFVENFDKGVKKFVIEKDRSKEVLADLKLTKSMIKNFNKKRKGQLSEFHSMNLDRSISREALVGFFEARVEERKVFQLKMIEQRLKVVVKINDAEWQEIIELSDATLQKKMAKLEKKGAADPFEAVIKSVKANIIDQANQAKALTVVENFKLEYGNLLTEVNSINTIESNLLRNKNSTSKEFETLANDMNQLREKAYKSLIDLHFDMKEITNENAWAKVMKSINKIID